MFYTLFFNSEILKVIGIIFGSFFRLKRADLHNGR